MAGMVSDCWCIEMVRHTGPVAFFEGVRITVVTPMACYLPDDFSRAADMALNVRTKLRIAKRFT
jgi:hypothetical protein